MHRSTALTKFSNKEKKRESTKEYREKSGKFSNITKAQGRVEYKPWKLTLISPVP